MGHEAGENVAPIHDALGAIAGCDLRLFIQCASRSATHARLLRSKLDFAAGNDQLIRVHF